MLASGTRLGPYQIGEPVGAGGMGEVYRAHDPRLGRDVALKVLPQRLAADPAGLARFTREARAVAALNHPHIVTIFSIEEADGVRFLTMELIEGRALDRMIPPAGMSLREFFDVGIALAAALDAAHRKEITHRDLKPANVMISDDGQVKVLDFGLAQAPEPEANEPFEEWETRQKLTLAGTILGTLPYMSPEQIEAKSVDHRSDIFSLGVVLYEMATGALPFRGDSSPALMSAILKDEAAVVHELRGDIPTGVSRLVSRCLAKQVRERVQTAREVLTELQALRRAWEVDTPSVRDRTGAQQQSIAVLPFTNLSANAENEYLSDGITEEILNALTGLRDVRVAARTSAFSFKGQQRDVREIAKLLNVRHVLQGSLRSAGGRIRVTAQLVDAANGFQLWSEKYDREMRDVFEIQDDIAGIIAERLEAQFRFGGVRRRAVNVDAHDAYLRGRSFYNQGTPESWQRAASWFERALDHDPDYADAHVGLAQSLAFLSFTGAPGDNAARAKSAVTRALDLEPQHAEAHSTMGFCKCWFDWEFEAAQAETRRAVELNPNSAAAHWMNAIQLANLGRVDEAITSARRVVELDPIWVNAHQALQYALLMAERHRESIERGRVALDLAPGSLNTLLPLAWAHVELSDFETARAICSEIGEGTPMALGCMVIALARSGDRAKALHYLGELEQAPMTSTLCAHLTWAHAAVGQIDHAFEWLNRGIETKDQFMGCMPTFSWWDPLRVEPRFLQAMRRAGFPDWCYRRTFAFRDGANTGAAGGSPGTPNRSEPA